MCNWDPPDGPLPLPDPQLYDAASLIPVRAVDGAATRETATCPVCLAIRRKQKVTQRHSFIWGECLRATPPPPVAEAEMPDVVVQEPPVPDEAEIRVEPRVEELFSDEEGVEQTVQSAVAFKAIELDSQHLSINLSDRFRVCPHACVAYSDTATWGSPESIATETDLPSSSNELSGLEESSDEDFDFDDEFVVRGGGTDLPGRYKYAGGGVVGQDGCTISIRLDSVHQAA